MSPLEETSKGSALPAYEPSSISRAMDDAKALREATSGFRTDKKALIRIIPAVSLDSQQMALLQQTYTQLYHRDLEEDIRGHIPSFFKDAILGMINGPTWSDVERLRHLFLEEREDMTNFVLCQIIFYRTQAKLEALKEMYAQKCSESLIECVKWLVKHRCWGSTAQLTGQLLIKYLETVRCEDGTDALDAQSIRVDAQLLHQGIWRKGEEMDYVLDILARSSRERLTALMDEFEAIYAISLVDYIEKKITGALQLTLRWLLSWAEDPIQYSRDCLIQLWPINNRANNIRAINHTMVWAHWNRTLFEAGKMRLRYTRCNLRKELERGLFDDSYRELMFKICDGNY
ncbi:uncharacterized protein N7446_005933 [Penicillium canescens]|uniref:Uncharacterized protein n=1 Tax=Penicillium canescens TaxID=5083 RepID=A0AAD6IKJ0_PENCN|nr:uncharacterized protein N7446_005933 [Penicillium canescens]KAJ6051301.1 hypothetical protein N7460_001835 [Penicillium canescens]KAJ6061813.1 hypothetical protein N7446_005933 [Penicillium canescens]KAJ6065062.1 hypothetical protein N7444_000715 [Penicillium canescens]